MGHSEEQTLLQISFPNLPENIRGINNLLLQNNFETWKSNHMESGPTSIIFAHAQSITIFKNTYFQK